MAIRKKNPVVQLLNRLFELGLENFGWYYSKYRAFVYDNEDPEGLQRLKLIIPQVSGNQAYNYWAFPSNVFYGPGYGSQVLPKKGDMVWVEFEGGRPEVPIWSHGHPARKEMPNDPQLKDPNAYWFWTPAGHRVILNDTKNTIEVEHKLGDKILLDSKGVSITMTNGKKFKVDNNLASLKKILNDTMLMYIKTKTIDGKPLDGASIQRATTLLQDIAKLFQ